MLSLFEINRLLASGSTNCWELNEQEYCGMKSLKIWGAKVEHDGQNSCPSKVIVRIRRSGDF